MSLLDKYLLELDFRVFHEICRNLDVQAKYRDLVAAASNTRFKLDAMELEECVQAIYHINGSPSMKLLQRWGNSMKVYELLNLLDRLRLERCQLPIRPYDALQMKIQPVDSVRLKEGDPLLLNCEATGFPYPIYVWSCNEKQLSSGCSGTLKINSVSSQNSGKYICHIYHENHVTKQRHSLSTTWCNVMVETPPFRVIQKNHPERIESSNKADKQRYAVLAILQHPVSQVIRQSNPLTLRCEAEGTGLLQYYWVRNMELISMSPMGKQYTVPAACNADSGEYFCIVKNESKEVHSMIATVKVMADGIHIPDKPEIIQAPVDLSSEIGGKALFSVRAQYCLDLSYQWYHLTENELHSRTIQGGTNAELRVEIEGKYNAGTYQCRIYASDGKEVISRPAKLTVTGERKTYKAADKLALIFGVSTYRSHGGPLPAVEYDLQATTEVLERMNFKVLSWLNLSLSEMMDYINMFCDLLSKDVYAIFYCAGHGFVGDNGCHYLIPWDSFHVPRPSESLCIETVEERIQQKEPKLMMFFLDICRRRNNNLTEQSGVIQTGKSVPNRIIVYAACEGQQAYEESKKLTSVPRGLFNKCLLEVIEKPLSATDLHKALIDKFHTLPYDRTKHPQSPEMLTNNEDYDRTLLDPIDMELQRTNADVIRSTELWHVSHALPSNLQYKILDIGRMNVTFKRITSNVMDMNIQTELKVGWRLGITLLQDSIPASIKPVTESYKNEPPGAVCFRFQNLQRLQTNLVVSLQFKLIQDVPNQTSETRLVNTIQIDLRRPLVSVACINIGQQQTTADIDAVSSVSEETDAETDLRSQRASTSSHQAVEVSEDFSPLSSTS